MTSKKELREEIDRLRGNIEDLQESNNNHVAWRASWLNGYNEKDQVTLQTTHSAFTQLLALLGVDNQTMAVYRIEALLKNKDADKAMLALRQRVAGAEESVRIHKLAIRQLEHQRDSAQAHSHEVDFEVVNLRARCTELEELLGDVNVAMHEMHGATVNWQFSDLHARVKTMIGDDL